MLTFCHVALRSIKYSTFPIKLKFPLYCPQYHSPPFSPKANTDMNLVCNFPIWVLHFNWMWTYKMQNIGLNDFLKCTNMVLDCTYYSWTCFFPSWCVFIFSLRVDKYIQFIHFNCYIVDPCIQMCPVYSFPYWWILNCCQYFGTTCTCFLCTYVRISLCIYLDGELPGSTHIFSFVRDCQMVQFAQPSAVYDSSCFPHMIFNSF